MGDQVHCSGQPQPALRRAAPVTKRMRLTPMAMILVAIVAAGPARAQGADPHLKPGFPVQAPAEPGSFQGGGALNTLVGNIDDEPDLEILFTAAAQGPLYAVKSDGRIASGWPVYVDSKAGYPSLGKLSVALSGLQVYASFYSASPFDKTAYSGSGLPLPGWPRASANFIRHPAALADINGDGIDEIFTGEEDRQLHAYDAVGNALPGWPTLDPALATERCSAEFSQTRFTPVILDLDGVGPAEIITATGESNGAGGQSMCVLAYHADAQPVAGFPHHMTGFQIAGGEFLVAGDIEGDGEPEIIAVQENPDSDVTGPPAVRVISADGTLKHFRFLSSRASNSTAPALADLDSDGIPELIVQSSYSIDVFRGDGSNFPGWPREFPGTASSSAVVVGDVDGDLQQDLVFYTSLGSQPGFLWATDRFGDILDGFPKTIDAGDSHTPAIADIDVDGRNDIVIAGHVWHGYSAIYDSLWAFDLGGPTSGHIEWGQLNRGPRHNGAYERASNPAFVDSNLALDVSQAAWAMTAGQPFTYALTVTNTGPAAVPRASVSQLLINGVSLVSGSASGGRCVEHASAVTCAVGALAPGATETIALTISAPSAGSFGGKLSVTGQVNESNLADNVEVVEITVTPATSSGGGGGGGGGESGDDEPNSNGGGGSVGLSLGLLALLAFLLRLQDWRRVSGTRKLRRWESVLH